MTTRKKAKIIKKQLKQSVKNQRGDDENPARMRVVFICYNQATGERLGGGSFFVNAPCPINED